MAIEPRSDADDGQYLTDIERPTVVHERSGIHYTFESMDELAVMFRSLANFFGVKETCQEFRLEDDTYTMTDVHERGWWVFIEYTGYHWLSDAMNDSVAMTDRYYNGEYDAANVGVTDETANKTTVLYDESPTEEIISVFRERGFGIPIPTDVFDAVDGSDTVLSFLDTVGVLEHDTDDETVVLEDSQKTTDVIATLD
jgi:hypothetical protein